MEEVIVIAACLVLNALLAAYEMAFVSVPKPELRRLARSGSKEAQRLIVLRENPERTLSIIQIGITLVGALSAAVGGAGASETLEPYLMSSWGMSTGAAEALAIALVVLPISYLNVVVGELVPKTLALRNPAKMTLKGARWLFVADRVLAPAVTVLEWSTKNILRAFFSKSKPMAPPPQTTVEIDSFSQQHQQYILNMAAIERKQVREIMIPWSTVNFVRRSDSMDSVVGVVFTSGHTRLPVVDHEKLIGVLHTKEFLAFRETGSTDWNSIIRPMLQVRDTDLALNTLKIMQENRSHMAVVGDRQGIVTLEDISEEIWGDIYDEDDDGRVRRLFAAKAKGRVVPRSIDS